ncbi:uncharacterized protein [Physcomitrium patens]|uniref:SSD domain-containing protein n=1 Tax=Physcomitrium patens TaxID=3218 RepID=A0A2K1KM08_PHYPA|nr:protein patched homolog 2-like [Physcomitrium patens]XP_024373472.1 protein patched homolog 2-like [Physcomitrium patens]PNR54807.1 hypothetical protein PHYPA_005700 [Physcomitrium patens]|eukprot:XP_024373471.1 protein patched homolog 2-like [Physcomitrella patens]
MGLANAYRRMLHRYHLAMNEIFAGYGSFVAHKPWIPFIVGIMVLGGLTAGLIKRTTETDLEKLWVEHNSRVVEERLYFNQRYGGIPRKESVTITSRASPDAQIDLKRSMDALTHAVAPLYDELSMETAVGGARNKLGNVDFCERPIVPTTLKPGKNPMKDNNWGAWGLQYISTCSVFWAYTGRVSADSALPEGWGITRFPCTKLTPMDCFKEGGDFDYPEEMKLLERPVPDVGTIKNITLIDLLLGLYQMTTAPVKCVNLLRTNITSQFRQAGRPVAEVQGIVDEVVSIMKFAFTWGYRWRKPYSLMKSNKEIIDHINSAVEIGRHKNPDPGVPQVVDCILKKMPCCMTWFGAHLPIFTALGSVEYDASGKNISKVGGVRWGSNNYHHDHPLFAEYISNRLVTSVGSDEREHLVKKWEDAMIHDLDPMRRHATNTSFGDGEMYENLQLEFNMWKSTRDIIADASKSPLWQIILGAALVSAYAFLAFLNLRNPVHSHTSLALMGMAVVGFAVLAGFGLTALCGIPFSPLAGSVVPFLALGLGIDDVFVLVNVLRNFLEDPKLQALNTPGDLVPEREMRHALTLAGPSVILTTFSVLAAFFISSMNPMPVAQWFCWQMGLTATVHTLGMILIFMPIMALDARRVKARYNDPNLWLFCGIRKSKAPEAPYTKEATSEFSDPSFQDSTGSSAISRWVARYYAPLFESNLFKIIVVVLFSGLLVSMTYLGFEKVEHGLRLSDVTLTGSYQNTFARTTEDRFTSYDVWIVTRDIDYAKNQNNLVEMYRALEKTKWNPPQPGILESSPLGNLYLWNQIAYNVSWPIPANNQTYYDYIKHWSAGPLGIASLQDIYCEDSITKEQLSCMQDAHAPGYKNNPNFRIASSKTGMFALHLGAGTSSNLDMMTKTRTIVDDLNTKFGEDVAFMYGFPFLFFEQYLHSYRDLYTVVGLALVGVFVAVLVFQFSITMSLIIVTVLLMVDLEVYGFIYVIGAKLNSLSLVNLGIVIGMSSEFTYLARSFLMVDGTRNYRVRKALEWTFEPLLHGFGTQIAATIPLIFVKYHAFRVYYFAMFTIMGVLGFLNGFVLLPVILSWVGPPPLPHVVNRANHKGVAQDLGFRASPHHGGDTPMMSHNGASVPL